MDPQQLGKLIDMYARPLELYARQWCVEPADVVQTAFLKLMKETTEPDNITAWLYRVVRNLVVSELRAKGRREEREQVVAAANGNWFESFPEIEIDGATATDALKQLPEEQREVVVTRIWGEMSFEEIAELTGVSSSTAHRRYSDGIEVLRTKLGVECQSLK